MKPLRIAGLGLAALLAVLLLLSAWALCTESGTRAILAMARQWLPAALTIGEARGTVAGTLRISGFRYHDPSIAMDLVIDNASLDVAPFALLARRLRVHRAEVDGVRIEFSEPSVPAPPGPATPRDPWVAPIDMYIEALELTRGEWRQEQSALLLVQRATLAGSWSGSRIEVRKFELAGPDGEISLAARLASRAPRLEHLQAQFRWHAADQLWDGTLQASGKNEGLDLSGTLASPVTTRLAGQLSRGEKPDTWRTQLTIDRFRVQPLIDTEAFETLALQLDAEGNLQALAARGTLQLDEDRIHLEQLALARREQLLLVEALRLRLNTQPAALTGNASLSLDGSRRASAQLEWDEFEFPVAWAGPGFRCAGEVAFTAAPRRFALNSKARLARDQRNAALSLRIDGNADALRIQEFELTQTPGELSISGDVDLAGTPRWTLDAHAQSLDPSLIFHAWPGALDFELRSTGEWAESGPSARFELPRLAGRLRNRAIAGNGDITLGPDRKPAGRLELKSGGASLVAVATRGAQPRVEAMLDVAALEEWRNDLRGAMHLQLNATGRVPDLQVDATLGARELRLGDQHVGQIDIRARGDNTRAPQGTLDVTATGLELAGFEFDRATLKLDGSATAHTVDLDARGEQLTATLQARGAYARKAWTGSIELLGLAVAQTPALALAEPAALAIRPDAFELARSCLQGGDIRVCAAARQARREFSAEYTVQALPLNILAALFAPGSEVTVEGLLEGNGDLRRTANGALSGRARIESNTGALIQGKAADALRLEYRQLGVDINLDREVARAQLRGELLDQGDLNGTLDVALAQSDPTLAGSAGVTLRNLEPLGWWIPQLANLKGSGAVSATVSGTLGTPKVALNVKADGLDAEVPMLGLHLRQGSVNAALQPEGAFEARGSITSGDGVLSLSGARDDQQKLSLEFTGANLLAANIPGARVTIAPDLDLTGKLGELDLTGTVKIETAEVNLEKLSIGKSYRPSADVVVVDREVKVQDRAPGLRTDVRILFGDSVKLAGFGLDATVSGELQVLEDRGVPGRATGEIRLAGTYEAFGRKLNIERGRLQFAGTALDDPQLDILAVRKIDEVTAKLQVTGSAQKPKLDVFTDPAMSQTDAMSYLLTGKPASDLHGQEGANVQSAAQSVGSVLGNRLAKKLGGKMGFIDEVGVEQNTDLGGSAFTVGKYLSPKLFVSYGVGLFEPGSATTIRYEFSDRWSLEANDTPEDSHAGVRYRIEK